jgi:hypothetical protein
MSTANDQFVTIGERILAEYNPDLAIIVFLQPINLINGD